MNDCLVEERETLKAGDSEGSFESNHATFAGNWDIILRLYHLMSRDSNNPAGRHNRDNNTELSDPDRIHSGSGQP